MEKNESNNIELRSEKVRNIIGKVPPRLISLGTVIITIILTFLGIAFYKIPYPFYKEAKGEVIDDNMIQVFVPYEYLYIFNEPRIANVSLEGYREINYQCKITKYSNQLIHREDGNYFVATGTISMPNKDSVGLQVHQKANVKIIVINKTLWQQVFK